MKALIHTLFVLILLSLGASNASAEPPEYKKLRNSGAAGRWEAKQYKRADRMDRKGQHKKAKEVRDYAHKRATHNRNTAKVVRDNWPGNK